MFTKINKIKDEWIGKLMFIYTFKTKKFASVSYMDIYFELAAQSFKS